MLNNDTED